MPAPTYFIFYPKNPHPAQARVLAHFAAIFDLLAQSSVHKTALCGLGAGVSVMPFSLYKRLDLNKLTPTKISLQMADKFHTYWYL